MRLRTGRFHSDERVGFTASPSCSLIQIVASTSALPLGFELKCSVLLAVQWLPLSTPPKATEHFLSAHRSSTQLGAG